ncbi:MAG TPA: hypothetical protein VJ873_03485, partial [bacterium]|nr:hypothetical protein [bacterium]
MHTERLGWFIHLRWAAVAGALAILIGGPWLMPMTISYGRIGVCVSALGFLNAFYLAYWGKLRSSQPPSVDFSRKVRFFLHFQMAADLLLLTAMLYFSGGAGNP